MAENITNLNVMLRNKFRISFRKFETISFYCQSISIPAISVPSLVVHTPLNPVPTPGTVTLFTPIVATILADEFLDGYYSLYDWMMGMTAVEDAQQYPDWVSGQSQKWGGTKAQDVNYSDGMIEILNQSENVVRRIRIIDAFPTALGEIALSSVEDSQSPVTFTATFEYLDFKIEPRSEDISPIA